jgi:hypothetical protein
VPNPHLLFALAEEARRLLRPSEKQPKPRAVEQQKTEE